MINMLFVFLALIHFVCANNSAHAQTKKDPKDETAKVNNTLYTVAVMVCFVSLVWLSTTGIAGYVISQLNSLG